MKQEEISKLYEEFRVPAHVIGHMRQVSKVCEILADNLEQDGIKIDKKSLLDAALVHDVLRVCDFLEFKPETFPQPSTKEDIEKWKEIREKYGKIGHIKAMAQVLEERGEGKIAMLVTKHGFFEVDNLNTWEEKIMYYADKRVDGESIVSLGKRFSEGRKRNMKDDDIDELLLETEIKVKTLEEEFIKALGSLPV
jgi:HD superfamily phosphohydrolase YqeK